VISIILQVVSEVLRLYSWAVILAAVFSTLVSFGVLDTRNRIVWSIGDFLYRITEPALRPLRNMLPSFGNIDISPIVLLLLIWVAQAMIGRLLYAIAGGDFMRLLF
jgi:YggT family protein